ncbi:TPA: hypothetical protein EYP70_04395 [Candidatus Bathyarchaeota archaeon]|nr:hypothetical protein [Candidatus Bathyarchaeota archaeon]
MASIPQRVQIARSLLRLLENHLTKKGLSNVSLWVTSKDRDIAHMLTCCGYERSESRVFMLNILSLGGLLQELKPLLERRVAAKNSELRGDILFKTLSQTAILKLDGAISILEDISPSSIKKPAIKS